MLNRSSIREITLTERIIYANAKLSGWRNFNPARESIGRKSEENLATAIIAQLTHPETVERVALDWQGFNPDLRLRIATLCNKERNQPSSNNKAKMIKQLDDRLGGKVLRAQDDGRMRDAAGRNYNPAAAAASRKYANQ